MKKVDLSLLSRFGALAKPYWYSEEKRRAWGLLLLLIFLLLSETTADVLFNQRSGELTSALAAGDGPRFWHSIRVFGALLLVAVPIYSFYYYVRDKLAIEWRRWLTHRVLTRYFSDHAFYRLLKNPEIDNPDQRIADDIATFTMQSLNVLLLLVSAAFQLLAFSRVLWSISHSLVVFLTLYAAAGTMVTVGIFGRKMVSLYFERLKREADFRFSLVRIRENAESIALYRGENQEQAHVERRFSDVVVNFNDLIRWGLRLNLFTYAYSLITLVLPSVIMAPRVLSGELEVGRVVEAAGAFSAILGALTIFVDNLEFLSRFGAGIGRLDAFFSQLAAPKSGKSAQRGRITIRDAGTLAFESVTLQTPDWDRTLIRALTLEVRSGEGLLITGASGCGKSSLLRCIAGLWDSGTGVIDRPKLDELLFLPQQPYMVLGCLRGQLCYPNLHNQASDAELHQVLNRVNLPTLVERCGGLDTELNFDRDLSAGERQRLAFARVLLNRPRYVLLDEATSALDHENEATLYEALTRTSATIVSVSHHPALVKYHSQVLELTTDGSWALHAAADFSPSGEMMVGR
jgi:putative ATP-binding cassette transporter